MPLKSQNKLCEASILFKSIEYAKIEALSSEENISMLIPQVACCLVLESSGLQPE